MSIKKVYLEITNVCNRNCAFCPGTKRKPQFMDFEHFQKAALSVKEVTDYVYFHLMGEPLLHPELENMLAFCEKIKLKVILTTNGTLLTRQKQILLSAKALNKISISLHSFEANETSEDKDYFENCFRFAKEAADAGIITVLRLWNLDGDLPGLHSQNDAILSKMKEILGSDWKCNRKGYQIQNNLYLEWGSRFTWPDLSLPILRENGSCYGLRDQAGILVDGTVVPCCLDREGDISLGNVFENSLSDILASERSFAIRKGFLEHRYIEPLCRTCGYAGRFSTQN